MNSCCQPRRQEASYPQQPVRQKDEWHMENYALAMAYVPMQRLKNIYEPDEGLQYGTIFPELNKPFLGWKGGRRN